MYFPSIYGFLGDSLGSQSGSRPKKVLGFLLLTPMHMHIVKHSISSLSPADRDIRTRGLIY